MEVLTRGAGHVLPAKSLVSLVPAAVIVAGIMAAAIVRIEILSTDFHNDIMATDARYALALKAADAVRGALSDEKSAMVMIGKDGLDEYATGWMTSVDHLQAAIITLELIAETPAETKRLEDIRAATQNYVAVGQEMYKLKVEHQSDTAIAISNSAAGAARNRLADLVGQQVESSARESAAKMAQYQRSVAWVLAIAAMALGATVMLAMRIASFRAFAAAPGVAGE